MSLLDKARTFAPSVRQRLTPDDESIELAIAFFCGQINHPQADHALGVSNAGHKLSAILRNACLAGKVSITRNP